MSWQAASDPDDVSQTMIGCPRSLAVGDRGGKPHFSPHPFPGYSNLAMHQKPRKDGAPKVRGGRRMSSRMSHPPAHRKERDEQGTTQYLVICFLSAFDRATGPPAIGPKISRRDHWTGNQRLSRISPNCEGCLGGTSMTQEEASFQRTLLSLRCRPAWGLVRTHGSMFFVEIGDPLPRADDKKVHGEWHFLVEMCHWRIDMQDAVLAGSDDQQAKIDSSFALLRLGAIENIDALAPSRDLHVSFSSGIRLTTFSATAAPEEQWSQWQLYGPDDNVWIAEGDGSLHYKNAYS